MKNWSTRAFATIATSAILLIAAMVVGVFLWPATPAASAQTTAAPPMPPRTITVVGEGKVSIKPDVARAAIGVEVVEPTVKAASAANKELIEAVLAALKEQGIAEKDIQTSGFSIFAERFGPMGPLPADEVQYRVSNNVSVKIRALDSIGAILDAAVEAGANNIYGVDFSLDDPNAVESSAREKAVADAKAKAEELALLTGLKVGNVVSISEVIGAGGGYYAGSFAAPSLQTLGGGGAPISPGELELTMQLQVVFMIAE